MNQKDLLEALEKSREDFLELIDNLSNEELVEPEVGSNWSVKDIMAHLTRWEAELVKLLWQVRMGQTPTSAQFSRQPVDGLNAQWYEEMKSRDLRHILDDFHGVRAQTIRRVEEFSDKDLQDTRRFSWAEGKALWEWVAADSFKHEEEHADQVRMWLVNR